MLNIRKQKKGFTLIELIVVMAVLAMLVLLAAPKFLGHTKEATFTKHISNAKVLEDASERYYIDHGKWPRGADEDAYTPEQVTAYADKIYDITGKELTLEEGKYWDIDFTALHDYAKLPDEDERANYILRNPVGKVYYLDGLSPVGENRNDQSYVTENTPIAVIGATAEEGSLQNGFYVGESINWNHTGSHSPNGSAIIAAEWKGKQEKYEETGTVKIGLRIQNELGFWSEWVYQDVTITNPSIRFSGLSPAAYDGDTKTYHNGNGTATWTGDLSNREIRISGSAGYYTRLSVTFRDSDNNVVPTLQGLATTVIADKGSGALAIIVPPGATQMTFTGAGSGTGMETYIHEISVPSILTRPGVPIMTTTATNSSITLNWETTRRVQVYNGNTLLMDGTANSFTDKPLYADSQHTYKLLFLDKYGNGTFAEPLTAKTQPTDFLFRGLSPAAYDGDTKTYHNGNGTATWTGDLSNREIHISGSAGYYTRLSVTFRDSDNNVVPTLQGLATTVIANKASGALAIIVPPGATQMTFTGAGSGTGMGTNIHEISVPSILTRPGVPNVTTTATNSSITLNWETTRRVQVYNGNTLLMDGTANSFTDKPLYADSQHTYKLLFLDKYGNGTFAEPLTAKTQPTDFLFRGLSPAAYDGDTKTYHNGNGTATWTGDLSNREIHISGSAGYYTRLSVTFRDSDNNVVPTLQGLATTVIANKASGALAIIVPPGATQMTFTGAGSGTGMGTNIHEISVLN